MFGTGTVEFAAFSDRYCSTPDWAEELGWSHVADPDWVRVAADMDVLVLSPWDRPRGSRPYRWDFNWDVPSGVVLNPDVAVFGPAEQRPVPDAATVERWASGAAV
jgi:hypothetical protein